VYCMDLSVHSWMVMGCMHNVCSMDNGQTQFMAGSQVLERAKELSFAHPALDAQNPIPSDVPTTSVCVMATTICMIVALIEVGAWVDYMWFVCDPSKLFFFHWCLSCMTDSPYVRIVVRTP
jgi:hypothetical protein